MKAFLTNVWITARHELADSLRSRRVAILLILYLAGTMLLCNQLITVLHKLEVQISETMMLSPSSEPGAVVDALWKSNSFKRMITKLVGNRHVAMELLSVPPIALVYAWLVFTFTPPLVMLSSSGRIAEELSHGSARFILTRTSRASWSLGKYTGQALELILPLTLSAIGAWSIARFRLAGMDSMLTMSAMIIYAWKAWIYSLAYVGMALGISQLTRSANKAMAISFASWIGLIVLYIMAIHYGDGTGIKRLWVFVEMLMPLGHKLNLWRSSFAYFFQATFFLTTLSIVYLLSGYIVMKRKDI